MFAVMRRFHVVTETAETLDEASRRLGSKLNGMQGFVSFILVHADDGALVSTMIFEDRRSLMEADQACLEFFTGDQLFESVRADSPVTGEIIAQRGM